jgi:hypothetical protein
MTGKYRNWKESTSTSPITKQHLGHYQCLTQLVDEEKDDDKSDVAIERAKKILKAHFLILSIHSSEIWHLAYTMAKHGELNDREGTGRPKEPPTLGHSLIQGQL